jgi:ubiquinone/menaquinone biosynthesis C-methylase UbiE
MKISDNPFNFVRDNLRGVILEIGNLHNAFPTNDKTEVWYCDKWNHSELVEMYKNDKDVDCSKIRDVFKVNDMTDLNLFHNEQFDAIVNSHVFEHAENNIKALKEWLRVIKTKGYIYDSP